MPNLETQKLLNTKVKKLTYNLYQSLETQKLWNITYVQKLSNTTYVYKLFYTTCVHNLFYTTYVHNLFYITLHITYVQNLDVCLTYGDGDKNSAAQLKLVQKKWKKLKNGKKETKKERKNI